MRKYAQTVNPGQTPQPLSRKDKLVIAFREDARPTTLIPALYSAGYEQLRESDPKYGEGSAAFGEKFGAAMLRAGSTRFLSDGLFASAFHQDPRYYRIGEGGFVHRSIGSAEQALARRGDNGKKQFNVSGFLGRAVAAALVLTYYPQPSVNRRVFLATFTTSIAGNAGANIVLEFLPAMTRRVPILNKLRLD